MGRGRAKAKQTKVARQLKYSTTGTDLDRLQQELSGSSPPADDFDRATGANDGADDDVDDDDPYAEYADDDEDFEEDEDEPARR